ncbi:hypothetical protein HMPREF0201_02695 [Cedecea davisae DSM 4568]|uniref:Uncharacterized protein n=1 Tax=Cedecea davisae DSM 4568 TaxID=566551 RepID=S3IRC6_9ENTR|nr:hypothetical protein HMPREF0201_02695 [Cedecea davisae DSM 4568]
MQKMTCNPIYLSVAKVTHAIKLYKHNKFKTLIHTPPQLSKKK